MWTSIGGLRGSARVAGGPNPEGHYPVPMRLGRIASPDGVAFVEIEGNPSDPAGMICKEIAEHPFGTPSFTGRSWKLPDVRLLAPILATKVICVGKNYADHAAEMGGEAPASPLIFMKPSTTIIGPAAPIRRPVDAGRIDFEGELAVVIGRPCKSVAAADAAGVILGYTVANDVTAREQQAGDGQWTRAKGYDTFCPLGPWIETELDVSDLEVRTEIRRGDAPAEVRQKGRTSHLIHSIGDVIEYVSDVMTLLPGDVILTGTPAGVGPIEAGDAVDITIEGIGTLSNPVVDRG